MLPPIITEILADSDKAIEGAIHLIAIGAATIGVSVKSLLKRRRVQDTATSKIGSAAVGLAEFQAYAWPMGRPILSAFGYYCAYYKITVKEKRGSGKNSKWVEVGSYSTPESFVLSDGTGACIVMPKSGSFSLAEESRSWSKLSPAERQLVVKLTGCGHTGSGFMVGLFKNPLQVIEEEILLGAPVLAIGDFKPISPRKEIKVPQGLAAYVRNIFLSPHGQKLLPNTRSKKGKEAARIVEIGHENLARDYFPAEQAESEICQVNGLLQHSANHKLLILDCHQNVFLQSVGVYAPYFAVLGAAGVAIGIGALALEFGF